MNGNLFVWNKSNLMLTIILTCFELKLCPWLLEFWCSGNVLDGIPGTFPVTKDATLKSDLGLFCGNQAQTFIKTCLPLEVKTKNSKMRAMWGLWGGTCLYLLQEGELLGNVLSAVFILAEGELLFVCWKVIHQGAVRGYREGCSNREGLLFR